MVITLNSNKRKEEKELDKPCVNMLWALNGLLGKKAL